MCGSLPWSLNWRSRYGYAERGSADTIVKGPRKNLSFLIGAVIAVLLIAGAATLAGLGLRASRMARREVDRQLDKLKWYYRQDPFASATNVVRETRNTGEVRAWFDRLANEARAGQLPPQQRTPPIFMRELGLMQKELLRRASALGDGVVSESFGFGFDPYFAQGSSLPRTEDVPRLLMQLQIIQTVSRILFDEGIVNLQSIKRQAFEERVQDRVSPVSPDVGLIAEGQSFAGLRFTFQFVAREKALLAILNRLAAHDRFIVVTDVSVEKQGDDVVMRDDRRIPGAPDRLTRMQRLVSGGVIEAPSLVTLSFNVYRFREEGVE